jgi:hypothetical protein
LPEPLADLTPLHSIVLLSDLDALMAEARSAPACARLKKLGLELGGVSRLSVLRVRLTAALERRWLLAYERARQRYGRGVAAVRERVCSGCFVTLPSIARPRGQQAAGLHVCESCGRILYWT